MTEPYQPPAGYGSSGPGYGLPPLPPGQPVTGPETEAKAIVALVLAITAYPLVPFLGAIAALVLVHYARRDILRSGGAKTGLGLCRAASILAILHLVFVALVVLAIVALIVVPVSFGP